MKTTISNQDGSQTPLFVLFVKAEDLGLLQVFHAIATIFSKHNFRQYARCCLVRQGSGTHRKNVLSASIAKHIDERQIYRAEQEMSRVLGELLPDMDFSFTITKYDTPHVSITLQIDNKCTI